MTPLARGVHLSPFRLLFVSRHPLVAVVVVLLLVALAVWLARRRR